MQHQEFQDLVVTSTSSGWIARACVDVGGRRCQLVGEFRPTRKSAIESLRELMQDAPRRLANASSYTP